MRLATACVAAASFQIAAPAQQVSPALFTNALGRADGFYPVGTAGGHMLQVHDDVQANTTIQQISFRPSLSALHYARDLTVSVWVSNAATTSGSIDPIFLANHGSNRTQVVNNATITFDAFVAGTEVPNPFVHTIPFTTPFFYDGVGSLCWEIEIATIGPQAAQFSYDSFDSPSAGSRQSSRHGTGCFATNPTTSLSFRLDTGGTNAPIGSLSLNTASQFGTVNAPGALILGLGLIDAGLPGTASGISQLCSAYTTPITVLPIAFDAQGSAYLTMQLQTPPDLHGTTLVVQSAAYDPGRNALGIVTSNARAIHWTQPHSWQPVSAIRGATGSTYGLRLVGKGLIVELQ